MNQNTSLQIKDPKNLKTLATIVCQNLNANTRRSYQSRLLFFLDWLQGRALDRASVEDFQHFLNEQLYSISVINQHLAAIRFFVRKAKENNIITHDQCEIIVSIPSIKHRGTRLRRWLTAAQLKSLLQAPLESRFCNSLLGKRDQAILAVLGGAGLRRSEAATLTVEQVQFFQNRWVLADIMGKGNVIRSVPIATWIKTILDNWQAASGIKSGFLFRACSWKNQDDEKTIENVIFEIEHLSDESIRNVVRRYSETVLGFMVSAHDLRRSFARIARRNNCPLEQIQMSLGHASIETTAIYTQMDQDFSISPSDYLQIDFGVSPGGVPPAR